MATDPQIKKVPEGERDPSLEFDKGEDRPSRDPVEPGTEEWRDGATDDGEQGADEALEK